MSSIEQFLTTSGAVAGLVIGFSFLIFIHELGHYLVAKWVGIKVEQFAVGFGHGLVSWRKGIGFRRGSTEKEYKQRLEAGESPDAMGETEYRLNWMPLGGYVKMLGQEDLNPDAASEDERSFTRKPIWARACVVSAGVVMNLIFGVIFFVVAFMAGVEFPPAIVGSIQPGSPAALSYAQDHADDPNYLGLQPGDLITQIGEETVTDFADVAINAALAEPDTALNLTVERDGEPGPLVYPIEPKLDPGTKLLMLGIGQPTSLVVQQPTRGRPLPAPLAAAGIKPGMRAVEVDGHPIDRYDQLERAVSKARGLPVQVVFATAANNTTPATAQIEIKAEPRLDWTEDGLAHLLGLVPATRIGAVTPGSPAEAAGIQPGDVLAKVGQTRWPVLKQVSEIVQAMRDQKIAISVLRDGVVIDLPPTKPNHQGRIGVVLGLALDTPIVSQTISGTPASVLNISRGSQITAIAGQPVTSYADIQRLLTDAAAPTTATPHDPTDNPLATESPDAGTASTYHIPVEYRAGVSDTSSVATQQLTLNTQAVTGLRNTNWSEPLGSGAYGIPLFEMLLVPVAAQNPMHAIELGVKKTHQIMLQTYITLARLMQGTVKAHHLRGPVGITTEGARFAKRGYEYLMFFLGLISVNLAVINFLPLPIVDGGLMVMLVVEKLKGSPVSPGIQAVINYVGLALIGSIFLLTLFYDVTRPFLTQ